MEGWVGIPALILTSLIVFIVFSSLASAHCTNDDCDNDAYKTDLNNGGDGVCHMKVNYYKKGTLYNDEAGTTNTDYCKSSTVLREYYIECMGVGKKDITHYTDKTCPSGYKCSNDACVEDDPCGGVVCNDYCGSGDVRYYNGKCSNGNCQYSAYDCDNYDEYYCSSGNVLNFRNGYCSGGGCKTSDSIVEDCDGRDTSWEYYCEGNCVKRKMKDYYCSGTGCTYSWVYENVACNGDDNYCKKKADYCGGCGREEYDCDWDSECSSGLKCKGPFLGSADGCCNPNEYWNGNTHKCVGCYQDSHCPSDYCTGWAYSCTSTQVKRSRTCYDYYCTGSGSCSYTNSTGTEVVSENGDWDYCDQREAYCSEKCSRGQHDCDSDSECASGLYCKGGILSIGDGCCYSNEFWDDGKNACCAPNDKKGCYDGDVYWYDSCGGRGDRYQNCGESGYTGDAYCYNGNVYRDYVTRGCSGAACTESTSGVLQDECAGNEKCSGGKCIAKTCGEQGYAKGSCLNLLDTACMDNGIYHCNDVGNQWCWVQQETCTGGLCVDPPDPLQGADCYYCGDYPNTGGMCPNGGDKKCESGNPWECRDQIVSGQFLCWERTDTCDQHQKCSGGECIDLTCEEMGYPRGSCTGLDPTSCLDGVGGDAYECQDKGHGKCWVKTEDCGTDERCYDPTGPEGAQCWSCPDFSGTTGENCFGKYDGYRECRSGDVQVCNDQVVWGEILCWEIEDGCAQDEYCGDAECRPYCGNGVCEPFEDYKTCFKDCMPPLGDQDYCKWKGKYGSGCSYGEWDCDWDSECSSGLDCADYNGGACLAGLECGCCNTSERWDSDNNKCVECFSDSHCPSDYCENWTYSCTGGRIERSRKCYDYSCKGGDCTYTARTETEAVAENGDWDYCSRKLELCKTGCGYGEYDCDSDQQCMAGLDCMMEGSPLCMLGAECGCCNTGEKWDKARNACVPSSGCVLNSDCQEDNYADEWEYYCTGREVRKRMLYFDYYCEDNQCKEMRYYKKDVLIAAMGDNDYCGERYEHCGEKCGMGGGDCDNNGECSGGLRCARGGWLDIFSSDYDYCCPEGQEWSGTECVGAGALCEEGKNYYCSGTGPGSDVVLEVLSSDCTKNAQVLHDCTEAQLCNPLTLACEGIKRGDECGYSGYRCEKGMIYTCLDTGKGWKEEVLHRICKDGYVCDRRLGECITTSGGPAILDMRWGRRSAMEGEEIDMIVETSNVPDGAEVEFFVFEDDLFTDKPIDGERHLMFDAGQLGQGQSIAISNLKATVEDNVATLAWMVPRTISYSGDFWSKPDLFFKAEIGEYGLASVSEELDVIKDGLTDSRITISDLDDLFSGNDYLAIILPDGFDENDILQLEGAIVNIYSEYTEPWGSPAECEGAHWEGTIMERRCCGCKYGNPHMNYNDIKIYHQGDFGQCSDLSKIKRIGDSNLLILGTRETNKALDCFNRTSDAYIYIQKNPFTEAIRISNRYALVLNGDNDVAYYLSLMLAEFIGQAGEWRDIDRRDVHASWGILKGFLPFINCVEALESIDFKWSDVGWCAFDLAATALAYPAYKGATGWAEGIKGVKKTASLIKKGSNLAEKARLAKLAFTYPDALEVAIKAAGDDGLEGLSRMLLRNTDVLMKSGMTVKQGKTFVKGMGALAGTGDEVLLGFESEVLPRIFKSSSGLADSKLKLMYGLSKADDLVESSDWIKGIKLHSYTTTNGISNDADNFLRFLDNFADEDVHGMIREAGPDLGVMEKKFQVNFFGGPEASYYYDGIINLNTRIIPDERVFYVVRHELGHGFGPGMDEVIGMLRKTHPDLADGVAGSYKYYLLPLDDSKNNFDIFARMEKIGPGKAQTFLLKEKESLSGGINNLNLLSDTPYRRKGWYQAVAFKAEAKNLKFRGLDGIREIEDDIDSIIRAKFGGRSNVDEIVAKFEGVSEEIARLSRHSGEDIWGKAADRMIELYDFINSPTPTSVGAVKTDFLAYNGRVVTLSGTLRAGSSFHLWDGNESIEIEIPLLEDLDEKARFEFLRYVLNKRDNVTAYVLYNETTGDLKLVAELIENSFLGSAREENIWVLGGFPEEYMEIGAGPGEEGVVYLEIPENAKALFAMLIITALGVSL